MAPIAGRNRALVVALVLMVGPPVAWADDPPQEGRITGRVVRADDTPVGGADVILLPPPPKGQDAYYGRLPLRPTKTGPDGTFAFVGLAPGRHRVWANHESMTSRRGRIDGLAVTIAAEGEPPMPVTLRLHKGIAVAVRVTAKATGRPISGAAVHLGWTDFPEDVVSDAGGLASLGPLTAERWLVEVWADGFAKATRWFDLANGEDAQGDFALEPGGDLEGIVRGPDDRPLAGVGVGARVNDGADQAGYTTTGPDGRYKLASLPAGVEIQISASKTDYLGRETTTRLNGPRSTLDLTLDPRPHGGSIVGRVTDAQGRPIAGATLRNMGRSSALVREAKGGDDGTFRLDDLFEGIQGKEVAFRAPGFITHRIAVEPGTLDEPKTVDVVLEPGHKIRGRVVDREGRPIVGAFVDYGEGGNPFGDGGQVKTDKDGRFAFDTLPVDCPFGFHKEGYSEIVNLRLPLDGAEEATITLSPPGEIVGRVVDAATNKPIRVFNVRLNFPSQRQAGDPTAGILSTLVDPGSDYRSDEGRFRIGDLMAGMPFQVSVAAEGYEKAILDRVVARTADDPEFALFALEAQDPADLRAFRGRLIDGRGRGVAGAELRLIAAIGRPQDPAQRRGFPFNWQMIQSGQVGRRQEVRRFLAGTTDAEGRFAFENVPRGAEVELAWWGQGIVPNRVDNLEFHDEAKSIEFRVAEPARIAGTIDREVFADAGRVAFAMTDDGDLGRGEIELKPGQTEFAFEDLPAGPCVLTLMTRFERAPNGGLVSRTLGSFRHVLKAGETTKVAIERP